MIVPLSIFGLKNSTSEGQEAVNLFEESRMLIFTFA